MTQDEIQAKEAAIVADLSNPKLTYYHVAANHSISLTTVIALAKKHGKTRPRGRKKTFDFAGSK